MGNIPTLSDHALLLGSSAREAAAKRSRGSFALLAAFARMFCNPGPAQFSRDLTAMAPKAEALGFSPEVTAWLSKAAGIAATEAKQMTCPHLETEDRDFNGGNIRLRFTVCRACGKSVNQEKI